MKFFNYLIFALIAFFVGCSDENATKVVAVDNAAVAVSDVTVECSDENEGHFMVIPDLGGLVHCVNGRWHAFDVETAGSRKDTLILATDSMVYVVGSGDTLYADTVERCIVSMDEADYHVATLDCGSFSMVAEHASIRDSLIKLGKPLVDSRDSHSYKTVIIGSQTWMSENLDYEVEGSVCLNMTCDGSGRGYTYDMAKEICPEGSRLPTKEDFETLIDYVNAHNGDVWVGYDLLSLEKSRYDSNARDLFGFNAYGDGYWTSTEGEPEEYYFYDVSINVTQLIILRNKTSSGDVRCIIE